ncbi:MAG: hypothetical protein U0132_02270 [Gemmatimonadaceae bacterium]
MAGSARLIAIGSADASHHRDVNVSTTYLPFLTDLLQLGFGISGSSWASGDDREPRYYGGSVAVLGNLYVGHHVDSRPYVGLFGSRGGNSHTAPVTTLGGQAGWLHFLTPAAALRLEYRYRHYVHYRRPVSEVVLYLDPYVGGRASTAPRIAPSFGSWDVFVYSYADPRADGQWSGQLLVAPFLTRWLQLGINADYAYFTPYQSSAHQVEGFGRLYIPLASRVVPFAGAFAEAGTFSNDTKGLSTYGPLVGVRTYVNRDAAIDLSVRRTRHGSIEVGTTRFSLGDETRASVGVVTQLRWRR